MYHDIVSIDDPVISGFSGKSGAIYKISTDAFRAHLSAVISTVGTAFFITAKDMETNNISGRSWYLTFDDGGMGAYRHTADILESYNVRGSFFIVTDYIGKPGFLTREQIKNLRERGHVIGSHSCSHPERISRCSHKEILREWQESITVLSEILGEEIRSASVPGGFYSRRVAQAAAEAGIAVLFTSEPLSKIWMVGNCLVAGRYPIKQGATPSYVAALAEGRSSPCGQQWLYWNMKKFSKIVFGKRYEQLTNMILRH